eukprot:gene7345-9357_t
MLVQRMVDECGDPTGFDAKDWLHHWLVGAVPALGDRRPLDVLKEPGGLEVVRSLLMRIRTWLASSESALALPSSLAKSPPSAIPTYGYVRWPKFPISPCVHSTQ